MNDSMARGRGTGPAAAQVRVRPRGFKLCAGSVSSCEFVPWNFCRFIMMRMPPHQEDVSLGLSTDNSVHRADQAARPFHEDVGRPG